MSSFSALFERILPAPHRPRRPPHAEARCSTPWLAPLGKTYIIFNLFNYISFRAAGATVTALLLAFLVGPPGHRAAAREESGTDHPRRGPGEPSDQARHADHGRADHHHGHRGADAALGADSTNRIRRRGDAVDSLDGVHRIPRRLPEDRAGEIARAGGPCGSWWGSDSFGLLLGLFSVPSSRGPPSRRSPPTATTLPFFKYLVVNFSPLLYVALRDEWSSPAAATP